jgi:hypothetical protein
MEPPLMNPIEEIVVSDVKRIIHLKLEPLVTGPMPVDSNTR